MSNISVRDKLRSEIFKEQLKKKLYSINDLDIEIREPAAGEWNAIAQKSGGNNFNALILAVIELCLVPNTKEKVFDSADIELLKSLPLRGHIENIKEIITSFVVAMNDEKKSSQKTIPPI